MYIIKLVLMFTLLIIIDGKKAKEKPEWAKKDIRDFSDADMERLLDQWEVGFLYVFKLQFKNTRRILIISSYT